MNYSLQQRQEIKLSMTVELRQAIELLQYSTYELDQYIRAQQLENPLIELDEKETSSVYQERLHRKSRSFKEPESAAGLEPVDHKNKKDELAELAKLAFPDAETQQLLKFLIYNLDDNGYLAVQDEPPLPYSEEEIEKGVLLLQQIGPIGIGAKNLKECLLLQIQHLYPENRLAEKLVKNHLQLVADHKWKELASCMGISMQEVKELVDFIKMLQPRPCSLTGMSETEYVTPDIIVEHQDGKLSFSLNDGYLPGIRMSSDYEIRPRAKDELSKYINGHYEKYQWLLSSIEQRRNTIIKIIDVLLIKQENFFKYGFRHLNPLILKDVAEEIGMHESTVSRATANKVVQTAFGSFELRLLFTTKLETADGSSVSQTQVKNLLQEFITQENKYKPYSDQKIAEYFNTEKGIAISRRTVSKYREDLNIPPAGKRKDIQV
ncbi:RNA polymerase factor sigma-54 [Planococcus sp. 1R117A]|uniref:RNA polymerase factor sigma-54 n=1 Tax=Planococcus sp. 1R117A TaxID=3447020 RepID=UPI003EDCAB4C